jgi:hypothetical protein
MADQALAERLKTARESAGHETAAEAARALNVNYPTYAGHENGSRGISHDNVKRYAVFFRVNLMWLSKNQGPMRGADKDPLDGLPPAARQEALDYIEFLRSKYRIDPTA